MKTDPQKEEPSPPSASKSCNEGGRLNTTSSVRPRTSSSWNSVLLLPRERAVSGEEEEVDILDLEELSMTPPDQPPQEVDSDMHQQQEEKTPYYLNEKQSRLKSGKDRLALINLILKLLLYI